MCKKTHNNINPLLWGGIILWVLAVISGWILDWFGNINEQDEVLNVLDYFVKKSPILAFVIVCILSPIIEEFAFRYWTIGKISARIISLILSSIYIYVELGFIIAFVFAILLYVLMFIIKKNDIALIITTSVMFSLLHINGFSCVSFENIICLIDIFSLAVVQCCIALKYHFAISVVIHIVSNMIAFVCYV